MILKVLKYDQKVFSNGNTIFDDPKEFDDPLVFDDQKGFEVWTLIIQKSTVIPSSSMVLFHFSKQYNIAFQQGKSISPILAITIYHCWQIQTKIQNCCYDWEGKEGQTPTFLFWHFYIFIFIFSLKLNEFDFRIKHANKNIDSR